MLPRLYKGGQYSAQWLQENTMTGTMENIDWTTTATTDLDPNVLYDIFNDYETHIIPGDERIGYIHKNPSQMWIINHNMYE